MAKSAGWKTPLPTPIIAAAGKEPVRAGRERRQQRPGDDERHSAEQHGAGAGAVHGEPCGELGDAARDVERADERAEQRPGHVELGVQEREERRERELEKMRQAVRDADERDDARVAAERVTDRGIQRRQQRKANGRLHTIAHAAGGPRGRRRRRVNRKEERKATTWSTRSASPTPNGRRRLTPEQYKVARKKGTERPFTGKYWDNHAKGTYTCVCCATPHIASASKYDTGTCWPSFTAPVAEGNVKEESDTSLFMRRTEVVCAVFATRAPGSRFSGRSGADAPALLHELGGARFRAGQVARERIDRGYAVRQTARRVCGDARRRISFRLVAHHRKGTPGDVASLGLAGRNSPGLVCFGCRSAEHLV